MAEATPYRIEENALSKLRDKPILERKNYEIVYMRVRSMDIPVVLCQTFYFRSVYLNYSLELRLQATVKIGWLSPPNR